MPVLGIRLEMRIAHQSIVLEQGLPVLFVLLFGVALASELFDCHLVAVEVLKDEIRKVRRLAVLPELDLDVALARSLALHVDFASHVAVSLNYVETVVLLGGHAHEVVRKESFHFKLSIKRLYYSG